LDSELGPLTVMDHGSGIKGYHLDVFTGFGVSTCRQWESANANLDGSYGIIKAYSKN